MLADGTFEEIAEKWGLEESICLSPDDQVQDGNAAAATATDTTSTGKKNTSFWDKFCSITKQLAEGLLASLVIFFLTLCSPCRLDFWLQQAECVRLHRFAGW